MGFAFFFGAGFFPLVYYLCEHTPTDDTKIMAFSTEN